MRTANPAARYQRRIAANYRIASVASITRPGLGHTVVVASSDGRALELAAAATAEFGLDYSREGRYLTVYPGDATRWTPGT